MLNIYSWADYAIFRALQGKAIPSHHAWDSSRPFGEKFFKNNSNKQNKFSNEHYLQSDSVKFSSAKRSVFSGSGIREGRAVPKVDGTLGISVGIGDLFSGRSSTAAGLYFSPAKAIAFDLYNGEEDLIALITRMKKTISTLDMLFRTSCIDEGYVHLIHGPMNVRGEQISPAHKKWIHVNRNLTTSLNSGNKSAKDLLNELSESCGNQFNLNSRYVDLIAGKGEAAYHLGTPYWFARTFEFSLTPPLARFLINESQNYETSFLKGFEASEIMSFSNSSIEDKKEIIQDDSIEQLPYQTIFQICRGAGWNFDDVYSAASELGIKAPFTLAKADAIAGHITGEYSIQHAYKLFKEKRIDEEEPTHDIYASQIVATKDRKLTTTSGNSSNNQSGNMISQQAVAKDYKKLLSSYLQEQSSHMAFLPLGIFVKSYPLHLTILK